MARLIDIAAIGGIQQSASTSGEAYQTIPMTIRAENPIIIIGAGRSGTSLLHEMFSAHPGIRMMGEFMFATYDLWRALWSNPAPANEMTWRYLRRACPDLDDCDVTDDLILSVAQKWMVSERRRVGGIIRSALSDRFELAKSVEAFWGFKEIWVGSNAHHSWESFDSIYPEAFYVHLVRHPFHFARSAAAWNRSPFQLDDLKSNLQAWVSYLRKNRERACTDQYTIVKYEHLVSHPKLMMTRLLDRLGLELYPACLLPLEKYRLSSPSLPPWPRGAYGIVDSVEGLGGLMSEFDYDYPDFEDASRGTSAAVSGLGGSPIAVPIHDTSRQWRVIPPYVREEGHAWQVPLSTEPQFTSLANVADNLDRPAQSPLRLFEDGKALGPAHSVHHRIRQVGGGRFSHWSEGHVLLFSTSDNSNPNRNGREYLITPTP